VKKTNKVWVHLPGSSCPIYQKKVKLICHSPVIKVWQYFGPPALPICTSLLRVYCMSRVQMGVAYWQKCFLTSMTGLYIMYVGQVLLCRIHIALNTRENISYLEVNYLFPVSVNLTALYSRKITAQSIQQTSFW